MMKKKDYIAPEMEITEFEAEDVITTSPYEDEETEIIKG